MELPSNVRHAGYRLLAMGQHGRALGAGRIDQRPVDSTSLFRHSQVAAIQKLVLDLFQRQIRPAAVFRPRHVGAVKITAVVEFFKWYKSRASDMPLLFRWLLTLPFSSLIARLDAGYKLSRFRVNMSRR